MQIKGKLKSAISLVKCCSNKLFHVMPGCVHFKHLEIKKKMKYDAEKSVLSNYL